MTNAEIPLDAVSMQIFFASSVLPDPFSPVNSMPVEALREPNVLIIRSARRGVLPYPLPLISKSSMRSRKTVSNSHCRELCRYNDRQCLMKVHFFCWGYFELIAGFEIIGHRKYFRWYSISFKIRFVRGSHFLVVLLCRFQALLIITKRDCLDTGYEFVRADTIEIDIGIPTSMWHSHWQEALQYWHCCC